jgi:hypothetical protein
MIMQIAERMSSDIGKVCEGIIIGRSFTLDFAKNFSRTRLSSLSRMSGAIPMTLPPDGCVTFLLDDLWVLQQMCQFIIKRVV